VHRAARKRQYVKITMNTNFTKTVGRILFIVVCGIAAAKAEGQGTEGKTLYENNFENAAVAALPDGFLAIDGDFKVRQEAGNRVLELPGAPAESFYGVLFGPATNSIRRVSARIFGTGAKRRYPSFGVGLHGAAGYCLRVSPGKEALELYKGDEMLTNTPLVWKSGTWTMLKLQARPTANQSYPQWMVEGKAWEQGTPEPKDWMIAIEEKTGPQTGRASLWGTPYSGTPIWFDDLKVSEITTGK
jgi:hypothetical protein